MHRHTLMNSSTDLHTFKSFGLIFYLYPWRYVNGSFPFPVQHNIVNSPLGPVKFFVPCSHIEWRRPHPQMHWRPIVQLGCSRPTVKLSPPEKPCRNLLLDLLCKGICLYYPSRGRREVTFSLDIWFLLNLSTWNHYKPTESVCKS